MGNLPHSPSAMESLMVEFSPKKSLQTFDCICSIQVVYSYHQISDSYVSIGITIVSKIKKKNSVVEITKGFLKLVYSINRFPGLSGVFLLLATMTILA